MALAIEPVDLFAQASDVFLTQQDVPLSLCQCFLEPDTIHVQNLKVLSAERKSR
jgi:hypothetical protein